MGMGSMDRTVPPSPNFMSSSVSVVVLSYERPALLRDSLASICDQRPAPDQILVINNPGPQSEMIDSVVREFPQARLLRPNHNIGFTGGMNLGLAHATKRWVYLTEDDIVTRPGCLLALRQCCETHADTGLAAPVMFHRGRGDLLAAGCRIGLENIYRQENLGSETMAAALEKGSIEADFASGAALFADRQTLINLGGFRSDFFMYYEDAELALRLKRHGLAVRIVGAAEVEHFVPESHAVSPAIEFHKMKNLIALYALHAPARVWPAFALRYAIALPLRLSWSDPGRALLCWRAWLRQLPRLPALWNERASFPAREGP